VSEVSLGLKKVLEYLRFSVLTSNQPVAQAEKNSTALPCGTQRRCRWYSGHGWLQSTALWFPSVHLKTVIRSKLYVVKTEKKW